MCDRSSVLIIFLVIKILILIILPITLVILYRLDSKLFETTAVINILFILLLIILRLTGNTCVKNSNFTYFKNDNTKTKYIQEKIDTKYENIYSDKQYVGANNNQAYVYNINSYPLKELKLSCDKKSYMNNYGSGIAAITSLISNYYQIDINEIEVISYLDDNKLIDCENGIDFEKALIILGDKYYYTVKQISSSQVESYVSSGKSVLVETINNYEEKDNFGCEKDYIVIYNINNEGAYSIVNPNDKKYSYFCPSNTIGYGSIIEGNQNSKSYSLDDIDNKALKYYVIEVK